MPLFAQTYFSLRYGVLSVEEFFDLCITDLGYKQVVIADINSTSAIIEGVRLSKTKGGIKIIPGVDFRNGNKKEFIAIAINNDGFKEINDFLTDYLHLSFPIPCRAPNFKNAYVIYPYHKNGLFELSSNEFIGIDHKDLDQIIWQKNKLDLSRFIICHQATFRSQKDFNIHRLLRSIDKNTLLSKLEKDEQGSFFDYFLTKVQLQNRYADFKELLNKTAQILRRCNFDLEFNRSKNLKNFFATKEEDIKKLTSLCYEGLSYRYEIVTDTIKQRIEKEITTISEKGFISYFLINWDMLKYARRQGYYYVGRGSGANSIVAYLLRITDVDPIELDLYFERFINLYRENPPDFDIDFSWKDRDDILRYLFKKYDNIALLATYNTFQFKGSIRELGKVFGLPAQEIDELINDRSLSKKNDDRVVKLIFKYSKLLEGIPNHLSIHAGGVLISEKPLQYYSATFLPPKGLTTVTFDMVVAEDLGLYKFDILSQRGLAKVQDTLDVIKQNRVDAQVLDIRKVDLLKKDFKTLNLLKKGEAIGCFYVESPAMRMLFKKLQVRDYLGLVAASSVIRPGVAQSGMMNEYIQRYRSKEKRHQAHPTLLEIMPETYGVMVYQEDVIKVAHQFAGLTLAESDVLRRGMSGKYRGREEFLKAKQKYFDNCELRGHTKKDAQEIWRQIESFAGYAFSKGHSASYAIESFQALYLKAHFPLEYMVATINNGGGFYRVETYLHEIRKHGGVVHAPCINRSVHLSKIDKKEVYLGFGFVKAVQPITSTNIVDSRNLDGCFLDLDDFLSRVYIQFEQLLTLINIGAFRFTGKNTKELLLEVHLKVKKKTNNPINLRLFDTKLDVRLPQLYTSTLEKIFDQIELLGYPLVSPFLLLKNKMTSTLIVEKFKNLVGKKVTIYGYLVSIKRTKTVNRQIMNFGTFLDFNGQFLDTVHFPNVASQYLFRGKGVYRLYGYVKEEFGYHTLEVISMNKMEYIEDPRFN